VTFLSTSRQMPGQYLKLDYDHSVSFLTHLLITLSFSAVLCELLSASLNKAQVNQKMMSFALFSFPVSYEVKF
jgi:hypothetical protein